MNRQERIRQIPGRNIGSSADGARASDILNPYVGVAEQNMVKMFREAHEEKAVLLLDEADTFLLDRNGATRSWEVSEVNDMLTQIESYSGIFIASTNLMGSLDAAALRRFDMKVKFDFLLPAQAWRLFLDRPTTIDLNRSHDTQILSDKMLVAGSEKADPQWVGWNYLRDGQYGIMLSNNEDIFECFEDNGKQMHERAKKIAYEIWNMFTAYREDIEALPSFQQTTNP